jgi:hypothetical protein
LFHSSVGDKAPPSSLHNKGDIAVPNGGHQFLSLQSIVAIATPLFQSPKISFAHLLEAKGLRPFLLLFDSQPPLVHQSEVHPFAFAKR